MRLQQIPILKERLIGRLKVAILSLTGNMTVLKSACLTLCLVWSFPIHSTQDLASLTDKNTHGNALILATPVDDVVVPSTTEGQTKRRMNPGEVFRDCPDCPLMVVVPGGAFMMGSPDSEEGRYSNEGPQHHVTIPESFAVSKFEITFNEWEACIDGDGCWRRKLNDWGFGRGNRPVISVTWHEAKKYVKWLSSKTGYQYRLLSEAEWEYVARAGTTTAFYFGSTISTDQANYNGNYVYGKGQEGYWRYQTVPVGSFPPNSFGVHSMHGNVWEWVEDCWHNWYYGAPEDGSAWTLSGYCDERVIRGGAWMNEPWFLRSAFRGRASYGEISAAIGFRIAQTLTPSVHPK